MQGKVIKGILLARKLLIEKAVREDRELVVSLEGKVVHIKARSLLEKNPGIQSRKRIRTVKWKESANAIRSKGADRSE